MNFIDPIAFHIMGIPIYWYGIMYVASFILSLQWVRYIVRREKLPYTDQLLERFLSWMILGVIIGGRLGYVLFYDGDALLENPLIIFNIRQGGMSFHGGLLGVCVVLMSFCQRYEISLLCFSDVMITSVPIGIFLGRLGNFINQEHAGHPTDVPWAMVFPKVDTLTRHPSQLYEAFLEGFLLFVLLNLSFQKLKRNEGALSGLFLLGYGIVRCAVEFFREPDGVISLGGCFLTYGQILSIPMILLGAYMIRFVFKEKSCSIKR